MSGGGGRYWGPSGGKVVRGGGGAGGGGPYLGEETRLLSPPRNGAVGSLAIGKIFQSFCHHVVGRGGGDGSPKKGRLQKVTVKKIPLFPHGEEVQ